MDRKQEHKGCLFYPTVTPSSPNSCPLGSYTVHIPRVAGPSHQRPRPGSLRGPGLLVSECAVAAHGALALAAPTSCWACGPWWHAVQQMMTQPSTQQAECISSAVPVYSRYPGYFGPCFPGQVSFSGTGLCRLPGQALKLLNIRG